MLTFHVSMAPGTRPGSRAASAKPASLLVGDAGLDSAPAHEVHHDESLPAPVTERASSRILAGRSALGDPEVDASTRSVEGEMAHEAIRMRRGEDDRD